MSTCLPKTRAKSNSPNRLGSTLSQGSRILGLVLGRILGLQESLHKWIPRGTLLNGFVHPKPFSHDATRNSKTASNKYDFQMISTRTWRFKRVSPISTREPEFPPSFPHRRKNAVLSQLPLRRAAAAFSQVPGGICHRDTQEG